MLSSVHVASVARSRGLLLDEIGAGSELTFVRGLGNRGDELIWAGTRELLSGHVYREIGLEDLAAATGEVALLTGGGAFSRAYCEYMPEALAVAELRFDRVIVLPSSFDVGADRVRAALRATRATVFAREPESYRRIVGLCDARLAHDCAFFFDFSPYRSAGSGVLHAFRTDRERSGELAIPDDNDDISATCAALEDWLAAIERHALVRTDRAHVMVAAALMGKQVEYGSCSYFKVDALAAGSLADFPVRRLNGAIARADPPSRLQESSQARATRARLAATIPPPPAAAAANGRPRVTAIILGRDRPDLVGRAVRSVTSAGVPARVLLIGNNADAATRRELAELAAADATIDVRLADRDLGAAGGRQFALEQTDTEYALFLDDDAEMLPGSLAHLVDDLDRHPEACAVTPLVVYEDGSVYHFGGTMAISDELAEFELHCHRRQFDDPRLGESGPCGWAPHTAALFRTEVFDEFPLDMEMSQYYEDNGWCHRVAMARPRSFRRCRSAAVMHVVPSAPAPGSPFAETARKVRRLAAHAHFYARYGLLLESNMLDLAPELRRPDGSTDLAAARLLMELITAKGTDWVLCEWLNGGLAPLLDGGYGQVVELSRELALLHAATADREEHATALGRHLAVLDARVAERDERVAVLQAQLAARDVRVGELHDTAVKRYDQISALHARVAELEACGAWLEQRSDTLRRIEEGGWWRLRGRLVRSAAALRRAGRR